MKSAVFFLTVRPSKELIDFAIELNTTDLAVYISIDDSTYDAKHIPIQTIQYSSEECLQAGFNECLLPYTTQNKIRPTAWDKALYHVCVKETFHDFVYFLEDDAFVSSKDIFHTLDKQYNADLLCATHTPHQSNDRWPHWPKKTQIEEPWFHSMMSACRLSKKLLSKILEYAEKNKTLCYHEYFFNTLAAHNNLTIANPEEFKNVTWRNNFSLSNIQLGKFYHPLKKQELHPLYREKIKNENIGNAS